MKLSCISSVEQGVESVQTPLFSPRVYALGLEKEAEELKNEIRKELLNLMRVVDANPKSHHRNAHSHSRLVTLDKHRTWLRKNWLKYSDVFADFKEVDPNAIQPRLELIEQQSQRDIFRIARLFWSLPYSQGYGRRLNYLLWDDANGKLMGILGLQSPPITLPARDTKYNIPREQKIEIVNQTMDAYSVGAVPPYSELLAGKLAVLAAASRDIRKDYEQRYEGRVTEMKQRVLPASLLAVTTLSAFGRSSLYNRVSTGFDGKRNVWATISLGYCKGWGTFYFSDQLYQKMKNLHKKLFPEKPVRGFGTGPKIRLQVIDHILTELRLPKSYTQHNIKREVFIIPHIENIENVLAGSGEEPIYNDRPFNDLAKFWKEHYCLPRAQKRCSIEGKHTIASELGCLNECELTLDIKTK